MMEQKDGSSFCKTFDCKDNENINTCYNRKLNEYNAIDNDMLRKTRIRNMDWDKLKVSPKDLTNDENTWCGVLRQEKENQPDLDDIDRVEKRNRMLMYVGIGILLVVSVIVLIYVLYPVIFNVENYSGIYDDPEQDIRRKVLGRKKNLNIFLNI